jgi:hypothetical protein
VLLLDGGSGVRGQQLAQLFCHDAVTSVAVKLLFRQDAHAGAPAWFVRIYM